MGHWVGLGENPRNSEMLEPQVPRGQKWQLRELGRWVGQDREGAGLRCWTLLWGAGRGRPQKGTEADAPSGELWLGRGRTGDKGQGATAPVLAEEVEKD